MTKRPRNLGCDSSNDCNCGKSFRDMWGLDRHVESYKTLKHKDWLKDHDVYDEIDFETCLQHGITKECIDNMRIGNTKSLHWICYESQCGCPHKWHAPINKRAVAGRGCQQCARNSKVVCLHQSLLYKYPGISNQLHPTLNGSMNPSSKPWSSNDYAKWLCVCACGEEHVWDAKINNRTSGKTGCPICSPGATSKCCKCKALGTTNPALCEEINMEEDTILSTMTKEEQQDFLFSLPPMSSMYLLWKCKAGKDHPSWCAQIFNRNGAGHGCPQCIEWKLERDAAIILTKLGYTFDTQFVFTDSRCRYDFNVHSQDTLQSWLLEMDGAQHFSGVTFGSTSKSKEEVFADQRRRDISKERLAIQHKKPMLRIPFTHGTLEEIERSIVHFVNTLKKQGDSTLRMCVNSELYAAQPQT